MISVDDRIGSIELIPVLQALVPAICSAKDSIKPQVSSARLMAGDICFDGQGRDKTIGIGIERKRVTDMLASIRSGRYSGHQLPEILDFYDEWYLIIEGQWRCSPSGDLERFLIFDKDREKWSEPSYSNYYLENKPPFGRWFPVKLGSQTIRFTELDHFIATIQRFTPVKVLRSNADYDTCAQIISLYTHHQQPYDKHRAHQALHTPQSLATIGKAGFVRRVAAQLSGVGWEKSGQVALKFSSVAQMCEAGPKEWETIKPGFGKVLAHRAYDQLHGIYKDPGEL